MDAPQQARARWFHLTPDRLVIGLLAVECLLWLSQRFEWFAFNRYKGLTVLVAVAVVAAVIFVLLLWFLDALFFKRRFQFSLRALLLAVVAVAIPSSWFSVELRQATLQRSAVAAIRKLGGDVDYHDNTEEYWPPFLRDWLGDEFFRRVRGVALSNPEVTDDDLASLEHLPDTDMVDIESPLVTDEGLKHLAGLKQLRGLELFGSQVTGRGLDSLTSLAFLTIWRDPCFTDSCLDSVKRHANLRGLVLREIAISDAGLEKLQGLSKLKELSVKGTNVTPAGVAKLRRALPKCDIGN